MNIEQFKPYIDNFTSRKFIALLITLIIFVMVFAGAWINKMLTIDFMKHYIFWLVVAIGLYLGVNLFENVGNKIIDKFKINDKAGQ